MASKKTLKEQYKLPKAFKAKWIKALRSGKYKQGMGLLKEVRYPEGVLTNFYCCIGVAGEICGVKALKNRGFLADIIGLENVPKAITGIPKTNNLVEKLSEMNDSGKSFNYIASWIERYL